jgi:hypothetical protein
MLMKCALKKGLAAGLMGGFSCHRIKLLWVIRTVQNRFGLFQSARKVVFGGSNMAMDVAALLALVASLDLEKRGICPF